MPKYIGPLLTLWWLWRMPWASDTDLSLVTGQSREAISRQLARRPDLVYRVRVGRGKDAVYRHVFHPEGVERMEREHGWQRAWHHSPTALRLLFHRLQLVEFCYTILPGLWRSTLAGVEGSIATPAGLYEVWEEAGGDTLAMPGQTLEVPTEVNLVDLHWLPGPRIDLVAVYQSADSEHLRVYLPVAYYGLYQRPSDVRSWQEEMEGVLVSGGYWGDGPPEEDWFQFLTSDGGQTYFYPIGSKTDLCYPSLLVIVPNPVVGLQVLRHERDKDPVDIGVIDLVGRVIQPMKDMCLYWDGIKPREKRVVLRGFDALRQRVENSCWASLHGSYRWSIFLQVHDFPGSSRQEIYAGCDISARTGDDMIDAQIAAGLLHEVSDQLYLTDLGLVTYAQSEGAHPKRLRERLQQYAKKGESKYRDEQASHNLKIAQAGVTFVQAKYFVYSGIHVTWHFPSITQIRPDFVLLLKSPYRDEWVVVAGEFEQNAEYSEEVREKLDTFRKLAQSPDEPTLPAVFITLNRTSAENVINWASGLGVVATDLATFIKRFPADCWAATYPDNTDDNVPPDYTIYFEYPIDHFISSRPYPRWTMTLIPFGPRMPDVEPYK